MRQAGDVLSWQPSLLGGNAPAFDASFSGVERVALDETSWVDHGPGWLDGADEVFADLVARAPWKAHRVPMYGRIVEQPRLTAFWTRETGGEPVLPLLDDMRHVLSDRYGVDFDSIGLNLYRDGRDSVAWHGDRIPKRIVDPVVAIVSVGEPRKFLLRPRGGGRSRAFFLGGGDLLVTGGACQRRWQHSVPKVAAAGPRISITFRHGMAARTYDPGAGAGEADAGG